MQQGFYLVDASAMGLPAGRTVTWSDSAKFCFETIPDGVRLSNLSLGFYSLTSPALSTNLVPNFSLTFSYIAVRLDPYWP
jgi:hypothetical protein